MRKTLIGFLHNFKIFGDGLAKRRGLPGEKLFCEAKLQVARSFATQPRNENYSCARSPMKCIALVLAIVMVGITAAACTMYEGYGGGEAPVVDTCGHDVTVYETAVLGEVVLASLREAPQFSTVTGSSIEFDGASVTKVISIHEKNYADVTISLDANPGILGFLADLLFDDTVLTPVSIMVEAGLMDFKITTSPLEGGRYSGRLIFLADSAVRTYETGAIATVRFSASEINHDLPIELGYLDVVPGDFFGELMGFAPFESGNALARSAAQGMTPPVVLVTPFTPEGIALGDADNDGWLTDLDVDAIRWHIAGSSEIINRRAADFDLDGTIDGIDVLLLRAALAGHPVPIGSPPQSLTIIPYCTTGMPVYNAEIEVFVNNVRTVHQTQTGIISIRNIPNGSRVRFNVTSASGHFFSQEITHFNYDIHGVQAVTLGGNALEVAGTRVSKSVVTVPGGNYIDVTLSLDANPGIYSFLTDLVFDTTRLTPVSITLRDDLFLQNVGITQPPLDGGRYPNRRIFVALVGGGTTSTATGLISTTRFRVTGGVNQPLPIVLGHLDVAACDGHGGIVNPMIFANDEVLEKYGISAYEINPTFVPFEGGALFGDVNGDGRVTTQDAAHLGRYLIGQEVNINRRNSDVFFDGRIDTRDLTTLVLRLAGHNVTFGVPRVDMEYRILVNACEDSEARINQIKRVIEDITLPLRDLNVNLIYRYSAPTSTLNMREGCRFPGRDAVCNVTCGSGFSLTAADCQLFHHRASGYFLSTNQVSHSNTFRFVDFRICSFSYRQNPPSPRHGEIGGKAFLGGRDMIVAFPPNSEWIFKTMITAHEIAHLLGAEDGRCPPDVRCVMAQNIHNQWCDVCLSDIARFRR